MNAVINHIKLNVSDPAFYKNLFEYIGLDIELEFQTGFGASDGSDLIFIFQTEAGHAKESNYKDTGLNHLAFQVETPEDVDKFYKEYLLVNNVPVIYAPREYKEYNQGNGYYAVFFESPDKLKLEIMCKA